MAAKPTLATEYTQLRERYHGSGLFLPLLLESGHEYSDFEISFSPTGTIHKLHRIVLEGSFDEPLTDEFLASLGTKVPLTQSQEEILISLLYWGPLSETCIYSLENCLKLFVRRV